MTARRLGFLLLLFVLVATALAGAYWYMNLSFDVPPANGSAQGKPLAGTYRAGAYVGGWEEAGFRVDCWYSGVDGERGCVFSLTLVGYRKAASIEVFSSTRITLNGVEYEVLWVDTLFIDEVTLR